MKNSEHKRLDQLLKDQLAEGTTPVPGFVWDRIEKELFPEKKRRGFFWWFFSGLCIFLMTFYFTIAFSGEKAHSQNNSVAQNISDAPLSKNTLPNNNKFTALNLFKSPGNPDHGNHQGLKHTTQITKSTNFRFTNADPEFKPKVSNSGFKNHSRSTLSTSPVYTDLLPEKAVSKSPENDWTFSRSNPDTLTAIRNKDEKEMNDPETVTKKELTYSEIIDLINREFPKKEEESPEQASPSLFSIGIYGGPSLYNTAVFKDYFASGQLSRRTFASSGFEFGLQARFKTGNRFGIYAGLAFNQKQTQFSYDLMVTEADYLTYLVNGKKIPLANIRDDGKNSCFLAKDAMAKYQVNSTLIFLGANFAFLKIRKFTASADLRLSCNVQSSLKFKETRVLDFPQPESERFSYLQPGIGIGLNYQLNKRISIGLAPFFSRQFYFKESFSHKVDELVIPLTVSFDL